MRSSTRATIVPVTLAALALAGCGDDGGRDVDTGVEVGGETPGEAGAGTGDDDATTDEGGTAGAQAPSPGPDGCVDVPEATDGVYTVAEAGTVTVVVRESRLVLEGVSPAAGWEHSVDKEEADEVEVELRGDGKELDLEVEIDDGRVKAEICADDD